MEASPESDSTSGTGSGDISSSSGLGAVITVNDQAYTAISLSDGLIVGSQTLKNGVPAATINGQVVSAAASYMMLGTSSHAFSEIDHGLVTTTDGPITTDPDVNAGAIFVNAGTTLTAVKVAVTTDKGGEVAEAINVVGNTLIMGGPVLTLGTEVLTANSGGLLVSGGGSEQILGVPMTTNGPTPGAETITYATNGDTYTAVVDPANSREAVVDGSATLSLGGAAVTFNGHLMSLASEGLVIDQTSTVQIVGTTDTAAAASSSEVLGSTDNVSKTDGGSDTTSTASIGSVESLSKSAQDTMSELSSGGKVSSDGAIHMPQLHICTGLLLALAFLMPHF